MPGGYLRPAEPDPPPHELPVALDDTDLDGIPDAKACLADWRLDAAAQPMPASGMGPDDGLALAINHRLLGVPVLAE